MIEEVLESSAPGKYRYLPHNPVIRVDKDNPKVRILFDASAKTNGVSRNGCLYKVPQLTPLFFRYFLRFQTFVIALTADIDKVNTSSKLELIQTIEIT